ncbi:MAG: hypothetical protein ACP6IQ_06395 [Candidatus Njordarchaeia archaeon]
MPDIFKEIEEILDLEKLENEFKKPYKIIQTDYNVYTHAGTNTLFSILSTYGLGAILSTYFFGKVPPNYIVYLNGGTALGVHRDLENREIDLYVAIIPIISAAIKAGFKYTYIQRHKVNDIKKLIDLLDHLKISFEDLESDLKEAFGNDQDIYNRIYDNELKNNKETPYVSALLSIAKRKGKIMVKDLLHKEKKKSEEKFTIPLPFLADISSKHRQVYMGYSGGKKIQTGLLDLFFAYVGAMLFANGGTVNSLVIPIYEGEGINVLFGSTISIYDTNFRYFYGSDNNQSIYLKYAMRILSLMKTQDPLMFSNLMSRLHCFLIFNYTFTSNGIIQPMTISRTSSTELLFWTNFLAKIISEYEIEKIRTFIKMWLYLITQSPIANSLVGLLSRIQYGWQKSLYIAELARFTYNQAISENANSNKFLSIHDYRKLLETVI